MRLIIKNEFFSLSFVLTALSWLGFLSHEEYTLKERLVMRIWGIFVFTYLCVAPIYLQIADLVNIWGNFASMTEASLTFFMEIVMSLKTFAVIIRNPRIMKIVNEAEIILESEVRPEGRSIITRLGKEAARFFKAHGFFIAFTIVCWFAGTPCCKYFRSNYPFDDTTTPGYQIAAMHQILLTISNGVFTCMVDTLIIAMTAVCRCRLNLVALSLRNLCHDIPNNKWIRVTPEQEKTVTKRLRRYIAQHQDILASAKEIQKCFTEVLLVQLLFSSIIISTTAYQLAVNKTAETMEKMKMATYLFATALELFLISYQGDYLRSSSVDVADAAYECSWYTLPQPLKRTLLLVMMRAQEPAVLTAGGFATLTITQFMSIMKASYSYFTVLQQAIE